MSHLSRRTQGPSSLTTSIFRQTLVLTHIVSDSSWKRILSSVEKKYKKSKVSRQYLQIFVLPTKPLSSHVRKHALRRAIWTSSFLSIEADAYTLLHGIGSRVFASVFSAYSCERDVREDTHVQYVVSLLVFDDVFHERITTVELSVYALRMKSSSLIRYLLFVELWISTKDQWSIRYIRYPFHLVKRSAYLVDMFYSSCTFLVCVIVSDHLFFENIEIKCSFICIKSLLCDHFQSSSVFLLMFRELKNIDLQRLICCRGKSCYSNFFQFKFLKRIRRLEFKIDRRNVSRRQKREKKNLFHICTCNNSLFQIHWIF